MNSARRYERFFFVLAFIFALLCSPLAGATNRGAYIGASIGSAEIKEPGELENLCASAGVVCAERGDDTALGVFLGYQFNDYLAVEAGYMSTGELTVGTVAPIAATAFVEVQGAKLVLLPQVPIGKLGAIFGKFGIMGGDTKIGADAPSLGFSARDSGYSGAFVIGVGGAINLGNNVTLRVEWERLSFDKAFDLAGAKVEVPDVDVIGGAIIFRFASTPR